jgi:hypothetical protein
MNDGLKFVEQRYPGGFYYKDLTGTLLTTVPWDTIAQVQDPLAFKVRILQLGEVLQNLVAMGVGVASPCEVLVDGETIAGTVGDIQTRLRHRNEGLIYLLIHEGA